MRTNKLVVKSQANNREIERKIMHDYMVYLHNEHGCEAPDRVSSAMCEIYNTLHRGVDHFVFWRSIVLVHLFVSVLIPVINLFRRKP